MGVIRSGRPDSSFTRASELVCVIGFDAYFKHLNALWERALGFTLEELKAKTFVDWIHPEDRERTLETVRELTEGAKQVEFECRLATKSGSYKWFCWTAKGFLEEHRFYATARDVTLQKVTESALRESSDLFRKLADMASDAIAVHERGRIVHANRKLASLFGYQPEEMVGMSVGALTAPESRSLVEEKVRSDAEARFTAVGLRKDGSTFSSEVSAKPCTFQGRPARLSVIRPVDDSGSEVEARRERAKSTHRLRAVGRLARGVAEEFGGLLSAVNAAVERLVSRLEEDDPLRAELEEVRDAGERAAELATQMHMLGRSERAPSDAVEINALVERMAGELRRAAGPKVEVRVAASPEPAPVRGSAGTLEQAVTALAARAKEAMPEGGTLTVAVANVELTEAEAGEFAWLEPGPHVRVTVEDGGPAPSEEERGKIFEGGAGLSAAYGAVLQCGGDLSLGSGPSGATRFTILLPRAVEQKC